MLAHPLVMTDAWGVAWTRADFATFGKARESAGSADRPARDITIPGPRRRSGITVSTRDFR
jgi:hypothetical protein